MKLKKPFMMEFLSFQSNFPISIPIEQHSPHDSYEGIDPLS